jgi:hypothetical protein
MFSRPLPPPLIIENEFIESEIINNYKPLLKTIVPSNVLKSSDFFNKKINLEKYKIADLKDILKFYKTTVKFSKENLYTSTQMRNIKNNYDFALNGKKEHLIKRVKIFFIKEKSAVLLQSIIRKYIVKKEMLLRGPALRNRSLCVNDTDFYTLEPLSNISVESFFSYKGEGGFVYGFDLNSIISLIKNSNQDKLINPYNRENMITIVNDINIIIKINNIIRKKQVCSSLNSRLNIINANNYNMNEASEELRKAKSKPLTQRTNDIFIEIDQLGNYTQSEWFSQLNRPEIIRYFRCMYDIWNYRAQLSLNTKRKICPLRDPFGNGYYSLSQLFNLSDDQLKMLCLSVMEQMILTGIDKDHKMLGAFHVLTALTVVSGPARANLPWLFESLGF